MLYYLRKGSKIEVNSIYTINDYLKEKFGEKVIKLSLDGGFTCPNRDGSKGIGGCSFCSSTGSGEMSSTLVDIDNQIKLLSNKWPKAQKYIAYFQSHTNTYASVKKLRELFYTALEYPNVVGIAIATRPDCLGEEVLDLLSEISQNHFIWIELGLQTIHENTSKLINRCYSLEVYDKAIENLKLRNIPFVTHLILGLPEESKEDMIASLNYVCKSKPFGIKLHMLNIVCGSQMANTHRNYCFFNSIEDYSSFICDLIEIIPREVTIHRLNGDAPRNILISPPWSYKKRSILNSIHKELKRRNSFQGCKLILDKK